MGNHFGVVVMSSDLTVTHVILIALVAMLVGNSIIPRYITKPASKWLLALARTYPPRQAGNIGIAIANAIVVAWVLLPERINVATMATMLSLAVAVYIYGCYAQARMSVPQ